jgi:SAM-dependent methyltransferase
VSRTLLHVGCGRKASATAAELFTQAGVMFHDADAYRVVTLDARADLGADIVATLGRDPLPLPDDSVDVVYAWHVLEHVGKQGEADEWFACWEELYRVLTPGGLLLLSAPYYDSVWAWADPTHTRAIAEHSLVFFAQRSYRIPGSMISPYRIRCDFELIGTPDLPRGWDVLHDQQEPRSRSLRALLTAVKPLTPWWEDAQ